MSRFFCPCGCISTEWQRDPDCILQRMPAPPDDPVILRDILRVIFPAGEQ